MVKIFRERQNERAIDVDENVHNALQILARGIFKSIRHVQGMFALMENWRGIKNRKFSAVSAGKPLYSKLMAPKKLQVRSTLLC